MMAPEIPQRLLCVWSTARSFATPDVHSEPSTRYEHTHLGLGINQQKSNRNLYELPGFEYKISPHLCR